MAIEEDIQLIAHLLDDIEQITRLGHAKYRSYPADVLVEHSPRAAATCTYDHMVAEADKRWSDQDGIIPDEIKGLKFWIIGTTAVLRFKKMDEDGRSRNYPTKQAKAFDHQTWLPGFPDPAIRLTAGYLLDETQTQFIRAQIARPRGKQIEWCAAIVPPPVPGAPVIWQDVTRQKGMF